MTCKTAILIFPGVNREREMSDALRASGMSDPLFMVWHEELEVPPVDVIIIPGGFSNGDYLRPGAIAAKSPVMIDVIKKARDGVTVLGICNGFQILTEAGLLPGALIRNASLQFICRDIYLRVESNTTRFTNRYNQGQVIRIPVANGHGNYFTDPEMLSRLEDEGRILFRYCDERGETGDISNSNKSLETIAGIVNEDGNILGLMPHPENRISSLLGGSDGIALFASMLEHVT